MKKITYIETTCLPHRKADEAMSTAVVEDDGQHDSKRIYYIHSDQHGYENLYGSLFDFLDATINGETKNRIESFENDDEVEEFLLAS